MREGMTRRGFLLVSAAAFVAPALPAPALASPDMIPLVGARLVTVSETVAAPLPAWAVGPDGDFGWEAIRALTSEEAIAIYRADNGYDEDMGDPESQRIAAWDYLPFPPRDCDWITAGLGSHCARCGEECFGDYGAKVFGDEVVCEECITPVEQVLIDAGLEPGAVRDTRQLELFP